MFERHKRDTDLVVPRDPLRDSQGVVSCGYMNREIKFRAWNSAEGRMYYDVEDLRPRYKVHLMQYTGLNDKNGKEIYEGDILKYERLVGPAQLNDHHLRLVTWNDEKARWRFKKIPKSRFEVLLKDQLIRPKTMSKHKVVSNIFENPELIDAIKKQ